MKGTEAIWTKSSGTNIRKKKLEDFHLPEHGASQTQDYIAGKAGYFGKIPHMVLYSYFL